MNNMKTILFSGTFLSMNDQAICIDEFKKFISDETYCITNNKDVHIFKFSYFDSYLKVNFSDGSAMPRNPIVYDVVSNQSIPNPRLSNQAEPRETFGLIDFKTGILWLSNSKKKNSLIDFFKSKMGKIKFVSKDIYDESKFTQTLKHLDDIRISAVPNLFSQSTVLTECLSEEINGYEASIATVHFHYQDRLVNENLFARILNIFNSKNILNGIVISGRDERNLGMLFNSDGFSRKIEFKAIVDENEMFNSEDVFTQLILKINEENN
jgi:hypothetical protein